MISFSADPKVVSFLPILNTRLSSRDALELLLGFNHPLHKLIKMRYGTEGTPFSTFVINEYIHLCKEKYKLEPSLLETEKWIKLNFTTYRYEMIFAINRIFRAIVCNQKEEHAPKYRAPLRELSQALAAANLSDPTEDEEEGSKVFRFVPGLSLYQNRDRKRLEGARVKTTAPTSTALSTTVRQAPHTPALFLGRASQPPRQPSKPEGCYSSPVLLGMPAPHKFPSASLSVGYPQALMQYPKWEPSLSPPPGMTLAPDRRKAAYDAQPMESLQTWPSRNSAYQYPLVYAHPPTFIPRRDMEPQPQLCPQFLHVQTPEGTAVYSLIQTSTGPGSGIQPHFRHPSLDLRRAPDFPHSLIQPSPGAGSAIQPHFRDPSLDLIRAPDFPPRVTPSVTVLPRSLQSPLQSDHTDSGTPHRDSGGPHTDSAIGVLRKKLRSPNVLEQKDLPTPETGCPILTRESDVRHSTG